MALAERLDPDNWAIAAHVAILEAIREGSAKSAGAAMRAHLEDTERDIRSALDARSDDHVLWGPPVT